MKKKSIKASEFDRALDNGENIIEYLHLAQKIRPGQKQKQKRVNVAFPV